MKLLLGLCAILCAVNFCYSAATPDDVAICSRNSNVEKEVLDEIKVTDNYTPPDNVKNFAACIYKKEGIMKEDGSLDLGFAEGKLAEVCKITDAGTDLTENVVKLMKCFSEQDRVAFSPMRRLVLEN